MAFAGMCAVTGLGLLALSVPVALGYTVTGAGVAVACGWPLRCRRRDTKALLRWRQEQVTNRELARHLTEEDRILLAGFDQGGPPPLTPRHWTTVAPVAAALLLVGLSLTLAGFYSIGASTTPGMP
ncbi:hypothetical protein [Corynebacterium sp.]|uniref:hypothetical protein n=1 Tax=Corynebacterium sp. TaxID=1720 RepID=UPI003B3BB007